MEKLMKEMHAFRSPGSSLPPLLIPEYSGINKEQRIHDRSKTAHRKPPVKCFLTHKHKIMFQFLGLSVFIPIPNKGNAKECSNYRTIVLISHASKVMLKILQARLQQYVNRELPDVQAGFKKGRGTRDQIANICWIMEKAREFQKSIYFCFIDYAKAFDCVDHNKLENSERDGNTRPPDLPLEKFVCMSGSNT